VLPTESRRAWRAPISPLRIEEPLPRQAEIGLLLHTMNRSAHLNLSLVQMGAGNAGVGDRGQGTTDGVGLTRGGGEEVILTRHGHAVARLAPVQTAPSRTSRLVLLEAVRKSAAAKAASGPSAAHSQDFL
jgi:hypothetical protein